MREPCRLEIELERMESKMASGEEVDIDLYGRCANTCRRLLETLWDEAHPP